MLTTLGERSRAKLARTEEKTVNAKNFTHPPQSVRLCKSLYHNLLDCANRFFDTLIILQQKPEVILNHAILKYHRSMMDKQDRLSQLKHSKMAKVLRCYKTFLFQTGSIKSLSRKYLPCQDYSFYSKLVRLKADAVLRSGGGVSGFLFQTGSIKR